jgi:membrane fusion protein, multidrug efflux system
MKPKFFILALLLCPLSSCRNKAPEGRVSEKIRVRVAAVRHEKMILPVTASGIVVPAREVKLSFKTGGIIAMIAVDEGSKVSKGDILATLNLSEIKAQVDQVTNGYEKALRDYNRAKNLYADSVATLEQLQNAETAVNVSKAALEAADFNLEHSRIISPDNGTILKKLAETNEIIAPGYPVFILGTSGGGWKIRTGLADRDFVRISCGDSARVILDAYPGESFRAAITRLSEAANPLTGTYEIELDLQRTDHKLASGFVANLEIFPAKSDSCFLIPAQSLVEADGNNAYVFSLDDSMKAKKLKISIVRIYQSSVAVKGLPGNENRIITEGAAFLSDGDQVTLAE